MTVIVDLQNVCEDDVPDIGEFQRWIEVTLDKEGSDFSDCELSIRLVDEMESTELNSTYRGKTGPTNVLSFPFDSPIPMEPRLLGDLVICASVVEKEAKEQNKAIQDHWAHMVVHGCLHLLAYDHVEDVEAEVMETLEIKTLESLLINDPYQDQDDNGYIK